MSTVENERFLACHRLAEATLPPHRLRHLLEEAAGDPCRALTLRTGLTPRQIDRLDHAQTAALPVKELTKAEALGVLVCVVGDPLYPKELLPFDDAPPLLFVRGTLSISPGLAIVGSRRATGYGKAQAIRFASAFVEAGLTVVSGGAAGVDTAAHSGTLQAGGMTVAVVACGLDYVYPSENRSLFERIVEQGGAIVSEFSVGTRPEPWRFPARNRIIAGLAQATVVIESPDQSGALITARNAAEYGRDVWVVPGPVDNGRSRGGHRLIQDGAYLADGPEDVLEGMIAVPRAVNLTLPLAPPVPELSPDEAALLAQLSSTALGLDEAAELAGLAPAQAMVAATLLEMKGLVTRQPGNHFIRS